MKIQHPFFNKHSFISLAVIANPMIYIDLILEYAFSEQHKDSSQQKTLVTVATAGNNLSCLDIIDNRLEGHSVNIWRRISKRLDIKYQIKTSNNYNEAIIMVANGDIGIVTSFHDITPERLQKN